MVHVIRRACYTRIIPPTLPDELKQVVYAWEDIVHEYDSIEILVMGVAQFMEGVERLVANLCEVLYTVVEGTSCTCRRSDSDAEAYAARQGVEDTE
jgi:hypothetical protein